MSQFLLIFS